MRRGSIREAWRHLAPLTALAGAIVVAAGLAGAALAAGPPFPSPPGAQRVVDTANAFAADASANGEALIADVESVTGGRVVVFTQVKPGADDAAASADAAALLAQWQVGGPTGDGLVMLFDLDPTLAHGRVRLAMGPGFAQWLPNHEIDAIVDDSMVSLLDAGQVDDALTSGLSRIYIDVEVIASGGTIGSTGESPAPGASGTSPAAQTGSALPSSSGQPTASPAPTAAAVPAGPPYPPPVTGQRVYDQAGVFRPATVAKLQATSQAIEARTGAQVVVFTQVKPGVDSSDAEADARALIDQWGIGRKGFDDGLVILFDLDRSLRHGQVQLYAGPGFAAAFLSNGERQAIYENDMLPDLRAGDLDAAVLVAMDRIDAAATPAHAASLQTARQVNALIGLVGAPLVLLTLVGWVGFAWLRFGRDPHYLDDPSIYVAGPPAELTPASGAFILDGGPSRRALTTALLDLASRGEISFREDRKGSHGAVGIQIGGRADTADAAIAATRPLGPAETKALEDLRVLGLAEKEQYIAPRALLGFGLSVDGFNAALERQVVDHGWYREAPRLARNRWLTRAVIEIAVGSVLFVPALILPSDGLTLVALATGGAGIVTFIVAFSMPAKTMAGAMIQAMLAAYRRTLAATMATARSMNQVVSEARLPWLKTPDQAMVWATAVGLQKDIDLVLQRSLADVEANAAAADRTYFPAWYTPAFALGQDGHGTSASAGHVSASSGGLFSSSAIPNFGGMLAALGTIGNLPMSTGSSSGGSSSSSSGGSFGGGSSGGGGGGAGGGF